MISDIHGNYLALEAVLESEDFTAADKAYCLGDLVGYYPFPDECTMRIEKERIPCVMGNHDYSCVNNIPCRNNKVGRASLNLTRRLITHKSIDYLSSLPDKLEVDLEGRRVYLVHGSPDNHLDGYVYPKDEVTIPEGFDVLAMGHTHRQFTRTRFEKLIVNPGSVGQPRDGIKGACFCVFDTRTLRVVMHRVDYEASEVIKRTEVEGCQEAADALKRVFLKSNARDSS